MTDLRTRRIVMTSIMGIAANVGLAAMKAVVGMLAHSVAIVTDALNNLTDALSSVITLVGARLAAKEPDREHPLGHGRIEHMAAIVIAAFVMLAGVAAGWESIHKLVSPEVPDYSVTSLMLVGMAIVVKIWLSSHFLHVGREVGSPPLIDSGMDARMDVLISAGTLAAGILHRLAGVDVGPWLSLGISVLIIKAGYDMMGDTLSELIGRRVPSEKVKEVQSAIESYDGVFGVYDLVLHAYGPASYVASAHIEVPESMTIVELSRVEREIAERVANDTGVIITALGVYPHPESEQDAMMQSDIYDLAMSHQHVLQAHGFSVDRERGEIRVDAVVAFDADDPDVVREKVEEDIQQLHPGYEVQVTIDNEISDV